MEISLICSSLAVHANQFRISSFIKPNGPNFRLSRNKRQLLLTLDPMKCKSGRKIDNQLLETPALKSSRKFRAKCAARLEEFEVRNVMATNLFNLISDLSQGIKGGNAAKALCGMKLLTEIS